MYFSKQCFVLMLICHCAVPCFAEDCVEFEVNNDELVVQENTTLTLNFTLSDTCKNASSVKLVKVWGGSHTLCLVEQKHGSCVPPSHHPNCTCNATTQQYSVRHFITGKQSRQWTLVADKISVTSTKRTVNITVEYPPEISKLTFERNGKEINKTATAIQNSTLNISCLWEEGNPPQSVTLKKDGVELSSKVSVQQNHLSVTEHVIHTVQCSDTGLISCEAPGARDNKTQLLYVKCGLLIADREFSFPASSGQQTLVFPLTAFYRQVITCQLWRYKAKDNVFSSLPVDCTSKASLSGSIPNLTLTIELPEGTSQMKGRWRLDLRNRYENGSVYFTIESEPSESLPLPVVAGAVILPLVVIVAVVIVVCRQRLMNKGKTSRLPPPPAPHTFRRVAPDAVVFHVQPAGQGHRDSFISVRDHIYSEIPDTSDESLQSNTSSPVSEGSLADHILRNIACPSSNSSLSDHDLARPNVRSSSSVTITATVHPAPKTDGMAAMTIAEAWGETPLDRNASMLPTSESTLGEDVISHQRASCGDTLKTATTVYTAGSGEEEAAAVTAEPVYENNITASKQPCHALNDDYLQPIVSALATERSDHPANISTTTMSTAADGAPQRGSTTQVSTPMSHNSLSDDYLHPIASVLEGVRPATPARSDRPAQGKTASVSTASDVQPQQGNAMAKPQPHKNLLDDNLHPVALVLGKKTTAASEGEAVEPPYQNTKEISLPLSHNTLPVNYLHPVAYTQEFATSIIGLSSSRLTTGFRADPPYENTREMSPPLSDNTQTDDYLHPVASTTEAATTTTVANSPCLVTPTNTDSTYKPPYENIEMPPSLSPD